MYGHANRQRTLHKRLAENYRTRTQAAIKRASKSARADLHNLDRDILRDLEQVYRNAVSDISSYLQSRAGDDNTIRLEVMRSLLDQSQARLNFLEAERSGLLDDGLRQASGFGTAPFTNSVEIGTSMVQVADDAVRFVTQFIADDGLQLSDRLWAIDNHAREVVSGEIQRAVVQGHSASEAARDLLARGLNVPPDLARKMTAAQWDKIAGQIDNGLLTGEGSAYSNARRVMRTEINRAHGEAYQAAAFDHPDVIGTRFLLSPNHPRVDICDMHARVNRYGLGPGVYPEGKNPWPAHPNTLSFTEVVFSDEVTDEDKAGKLDRIEWLKGQTAQTQTGILGENKRAALLRGLLNERQINTPWRALKKRYARQGIDVDNLKPPVQNQKTIQGTVVTGMDPADFQQYVNGALASAPASVVSVIEKTANPDKINIKPSGGSWFQGKSIVLARTSMQPRKGFHSRYDVYRHEYGHHIDHWALSPDGVKPVPPITQTPNSSGGLSGSLLRAKKSLYANSTAKKARRDRLRMEIIERQDTDLADLFGALTNNRIGWGHSKSYLSRPGAAEAEVFANLFEIYSRENRSAWDLIVKELPDMAADFIELMERLAK